MLCHSLAFLFEHIHMKIYGITALLFILTLPAFGQRFLQQNTGTLYDSFENPSQRAFIPDSSRYVAFNFFIPNGGSNLYVKGNAQGTIKSRLLGDKNPWYGANLRIGEGAYNHLRTSTNEYLIMARFFGKLGSNTEYGFSVQARSDGYAAMTDETLALFDRVIPASNFPENSYSNIFNDKVYHQAWTQVSFTYKEDISKYAGLGVKISALSGIEYTDLTINRSSLNIDRPAESFDLSLGGKYVTSFSSGEFEKRTIYPRFTNPGAAITFGGWYVAPNGIKFQAHVKDLGFIHWKQEGARIFEFNSGRTVENAQDRNRETRTLTRVFTILEGNPVQKSFVRPIDSRFEAMLSRPFYILNDASLVYKPTLIAAKNFFDQRFDAALVNQLTYRNISGSLSARLDDNKVFAVGGQFMLKSPNVEFFLGSESLYQSYQTTKAVAGSQTSQQTNFGYSGASVYLGFSLKFGRLIESPMNASYIPMGERSFFGRLYNRFFESNR